jgi:hypothetical protein
VDTALTASNAINNQAKNEIYKVQLIADPTTRRPVSSVPPLRNRSPHLRIIVVVMTFSRVPTSVEWLVERIVGNSKECADHEEDEDHDKSHPGEGDQCGKYPTSLVLMTEP